MRVDKGVDRGVEGRVEGEIGLDFTVSFSSLLPPNTPSFSQHLSPNPKIITPTFINIYKYLYNIYKWTKAFTHEQYKH